MALEGHITVDTEQLRTQSGEVRNQLNTMTSRFERLKELVNGTSSYWIGDAGDAHRKQYMKRISQIEEMLARYMEHVTDIEKIAGIYERTEKAANETASDLPGSILD